MDTDTTTCGAERRCAAALLLGVAAGIGAMLFHPTGHELLSGVDRPAVVRRDQVVHAVAIAALVLQCFGLLGLTRRLRGAQFGAAEFAMVLYALATVAATVAALVSGFVAPGLLDIESGRDAVWRSNRLLNRSCAALFVMASTAAIVAWSAAGWRRALPRWVSRFGVVGPVLVAGLVLVGHLRLDVHGFLAVVLVEAVWTVGVARSLRRPPA